jgi:YVTN family beta-propeller protein
VTRSRRGAAAALLVAAAAAAGTALAAETVGPESGLLPSGRKLDPAGRLTALGAFPTGGALTPDGRFYWAVDAGRGNNFVRVIDVASGSVEQTLPLPGGYVGVAFAPDGRRAYVSGQPAEGRQPAEAKGREGDVVHVYDVDAKTGRATELDPIAIAGARDGAAAADELPPASGVNAWPEGLAVMPDGRHLVVALGQADQVAIVDLRTRAVTLADVGRYPYGVAADPRRGRAYVTNERDGTVSVVEVPSGDVTATISVGGERGNDYAHPEGIAMDPGRDRAYVAVTDRDLVAVIDTSKQEVERYLNVGRPEGMGTRCTWRTRARTRSPCSRSSGGPRRPRRRARRCARARRARSASTCARRGRPAAGRATRAARPPCASATCSASGCARAAGRRRSRTPPTGGPSCGRSGSARPHSAGAFRSGGSSARSRRR